MEIVGLIFAILIGITIIFLFAIAKVTIKKKTQQKEQRYIKQMQEEMHERELEKHQRLLILEERWKMQYRTWTIEALKIELNTLPSSSWKRNPCKEVLIEKLNQQKK